MMHIYQTQLTGKNDGLSLLVFTKSPDEELGEIAGVDELTERLASTTNDERSVVL
jgi:hypothetical protein